MSITLEELRTFPSGKNITVGTGDNAQIWTRTTDNNWLSNGVTLTDAHFEGAVSAGQVTVGSGMPLSVESWLRRTTNDNWCYIREDLGDQVYRFTEFTYGGIFISHGEEAFNPRQVRVEPPAASISNIVIPLLGAPVAASKYQDLVEALHTMHQDLCNGSDPIDAAFLDETLEGLGIARREMVPVRVQVKGTTEIVPALQANDYVRIDVVPTVTVPWSFEFTKEVEVKPGTCACSGVSDSDVQTRAPEHNSFEFTVSCPNDK